MILLYRLTFEVTVTSDEAVEMLELSDILVVNGSALEPTETGTGFAFMVQPFTNGNDVIVSIADGVVTDLAGNLAAGVALDPIATVDTSPSVVLSTGTDSSIVNGPFTLYIHFSEPVTGLEIGEFVLTNGEASELAGSGSIYTFTVTPTEEGEVTILIPADSVVDTHSKGNAASNELVVGHSTEDPTGPAPGGGGGGGGCAVGTGSTSALPILFALMGMIALRLRRRQQA